MLTSSRSRFLALGLLVLAATGGTAQAATLPGSFRGNAFASFANLKAGPVSASLGRSAFVSCACEGTNGQVVSKEVDTISAGNNGNVLISPVTQSTVLTQSTATTAEVQNTSTVNGLNALGGMITANAIKASADVSATAKTMTSSSSGSGFDNLNVAGQAVPANVPPNTVMQLPGIGTVTLNKVTVTGNFRKAGSILVEMVSIDVTAKNGLGLAVGSKIVLAHALAAFYRTTPTDVFGGQAFAALANDSIGSVTENRIGKAALVNIGCEGTGGKTRTASIASLNASGVLNTGDAMTTAFAGPEGGAQVARTTAQISNVNLLGGLITVGTIQAVAQDSIQNGVETPSTDGSGFAGLTVAGIPVPITVPPNTTLSLPGIGTVVVNEQTVNGNGNVSVNGLHITVSSLNLLGLPVGTDLVVAHASASAAPF